MQPVPTFCFLQWVRCAYFSHLVLLLSCASLSEEGTTATTGGVLGGSSTVPLPRHPGERPRAGQSQVLTWHRRAGARGRLPRRLQSDLQGAEPTSILMQSPPAGSAKICHCTSCDSGRVHGLWKTVPRQKVAGVCSAYTSCVRPDQHCRSGWSHRPASER
jgi:hypothetical protein